jgi:L-fuconolactonase
LYNGPGLVQHAKEDRMIIDTHVHFYDPSRPQGVPYPSPGDELLYRTVLPEHYKKLAVPEGVTGLVVVEASEWVEDNQWVLDLAADDPFIVGVVGNLDLRTSEFAKNLGRFSANELFRGIRARGLDPSDFTSSPVLNAAERMADMNLELDVLLGYRDYGELIGFVDRVPELRVVLNHIGQGRPIDGKAANPRWADAMQRIAEYPRVYCKVSAVIEMAAVRPAPVNVDFYGPTLDVLWDAFGEDRLVYGSNWPPVEEAGTFAAAHGVAKAYFEAKGGEVAEKFFWRNSKAAYKWLERG